MARKSTKVSGVEVATPLKVPRRLTNIEQLVLCELPFAKHEHSVEIGEMMERVWRDPELGESAFWGREDADLIWSNRGDFAVSFWPAHAALYFFVSGRTVAGCEAALYIYRGLGGEWTIDVLPLWSRLRRNARVPGLRG